MCPVYSSMSGSHISIASSRDSLSESTNQDSAYQDVIEIDGTGETATMETSTLELIAFGEGNNGPPLRDDGSEISDISTGELLLRAEVAFISEYPTGGNP